jgi:N utilization substance protein B
VVALQALYEAESVGHDPCSAVTRLAEETALPEKLAQFAIELVTGVIQHKQEIDATIRRYAPAWPVEQLALLDRNILRLAIFEILHDNSAPVKVAINEAVELAKAFGSDSSARFINGVLGSVVADSPKAP